MAGFHTAASAFHLTESRCSNAELAVLSGAAAELQACPNLTAVFGRAVPKPALLIGLFACAAAWSSTRSKSSAFDDYCRTEEGLAWINLRETMAKLQPVLTQVIAADPIVGAQFPSLARLLGAKSAAAHRAVATRKANMEKEAKGEPATRGSVAKAKRKAAAKLALAEKLAAEAAAPVANGVVASAATADGVAHS